MAYTALYRKYRPASFDEVVGQRQIVQTLKNAVEKNRIAHAYLFCGPRGTGKTSIAKIFAKTLNCTGEHKPCGECENCKMAIQGSHPDIIEIDAASNNGVDEVRNLIDLIHYAPIHGRYKVYIIDEVHMMTQGAFNALLKTIEEPPAHAIFIFATTEPNKVLPTILSRCQRYDFSKISDEDILLRLKQVCETEQIPADEEGLKLIAKLADGGMRDSLSILDQCIAYSPEQLSAQTVREIYGLVTSEDIGKIHSKLNREGIEEALESLNQIYHSGMEMKRFLSDFISLLKNSLLYDLSRTSPLISERQKKVINDYFIQSSASKRMNLLDNLMETYNKLNYASNILDYIETAFLKSSYEIENPVNTQPPGIPERISSIPKNGSESHTSHSDIQKNTPKTSPNQTLAQIFWQSDVSRETLHNETHSKSLIRFEDEFLLSLLSGASKSEKEKDNEALKNLSEHELDLKTAKFAISLKDASLTASAGTYLLFNVRTQAEANQINEYQLNEGYENLINRLTGSPKVVYAIPNKRTRSIVQEFKKRARENTLPEPFVAQVRDIQDDQEEDPQTIIQKFFPDLEIVQD